MSLSTESKQIQDVSLVKNEPSEENASVINLPEKPIVVMQPSRGWISINLEDLWNYHDLLYIHDENKVAGKNAYIVYQKIINETGVEVSEITNEQPIVLETKIRLEKFQEIMKLSLSLQSKTKGGIFTVDIKLKDIVNSGEKEKIVRLEIPPNVIPPNFYSWISAIHLPGTGLVGVLCDECDFLSTMPARNSPNPKARISAALICLIIKVRYSIHKLLGNISLEFRQKV